MRWSTRSLKRARKCRNRRRSIAAKQTKLKETEGKATKGKQDPDYARLAREISSDEEALEQLRSEMKPRVRREEELAIITRRTETGIESSRPAERGTRQDAFRSGRQPRDGADAEGTLRRATEECRAEQRRHDGFGVQARRTGSSGEGVRNDRATGIPPSDGARRSGAGHAGDGGGASRCAGGVVPLQTWHWPPRAAVRCRLPWRSSGSGWSGASAIRNRSSSSRP